MAQIDVSIIIVNYNGGQFLENCLSSIYDSVDVSYEVLIIDNVSSKEEREWLLTIAMAHTNTVVILNDNNDGFAKANNKGAHAAKGKVLHFLNPDTVVSGDINRIYRDALSEQDKFLYGTTLYEGDNQLESEKAIFTIGNYWRYLTGRSYIPWYIGASIIIRKDVFEEIGGWPEDYFMYSEDADFCYKAYKSGINLSLKKTNIQHIGGGTSKKTWSNYQTMLRKEHSQRKFYLKYNMMTSYYARKTIAILKNVVHPMKLITMLRVIFRVHFEE